MPPGVLFCGPGTWLWNPFQRARISKQRAHILYRAWLDDLLTPTILRAAWFGPDEIEQLNRWRRLLIRALPRIAGATLRCICHRNDPWCHRRSLQTAALAGLAA